MKIRPHPGTWAHAESSARAELHRLPQIKATAETPHFPFMLCAVLHDRPATPWRDSWQEVLSDVRILFPESSNLVLASA